MSSYLRAVQKDYARAILRTFNGISDYSIDWWGTDSIMLKVKIGDGCEIQILRDIAAQRYRRISVAIDDEAIIDDTCMFVGLRDVRKHVKRRLKHMGGFIKQAVREI